MGKFGRSVALALEGIWFAVRTQRHMRIHVAAALLVSVLAALVSLRPLEWAILLLTIAIVICTELVNTAIEQAVNLASPHIHPYAKAAKDVAAGAVLAASIIAVIIGALIIGPPLWQMLN